MIAISEQWIGTVFCATADLVMHKADILFGVLNGMSGLCATVMFNDQGMGIRRTEACRNKPLAFITIVLTDYGRYSDGLFGAHHKNKRL